MALGMIRDKKTGRKRKVDPKKSRVAKKASRKRVGKKLKPATKAKIARGVKKANKTHKTKAGRRVVKSTARRGRPPAKRGPGRPRKIASVIKRRGRPPAKRGPGRRPGFSHSAATIKKMRKSHKARWVTNGARYRKARKKRRG
jgi:hypothetical protein